MSNIQHSISNVQVDSRRTRLDRIKRIFQDLQDWHSFPARHASRRIAQRKRLRASAPLRENRLFLFFFPIPNPQTPILLPQRRRDAENLLVGHRCGTLPSMRFPRRGSSGILEAEDFRAGQD
jgi:hypothetical protein